LKGCDVIVANRNESNSRFKFIIAGVFAVIIIVVIFSSVNARKAPTQKEGGLFPLRITDSTAPSTFEVAERLTGVNIMREQGIDLQPVIIQGGEGGTVSMQAMLANQIDVSGGSPSIWVNAVSQGAKVRLVAVNVTTPEPEYSGMLVLENSDIRNIKDLAGKKIAINVLGASAEFVLRMFLRSNGLRFEDVQVVVLKAAQQEQALRSGQVDGALWTASGGVEFDRALDAGGLRRLPGTAHEESSGKLAATGYGFQQEFIDRHPDIVRGFVKANDAANRVVYGAYLKDPERVRRVYAEISTEKGANPELAKYYRGSRWAPSNEKLRDYDIQFWIDNLEEGGTIEKGKVKPSDVYTNEYFPGEPLILDILDE
jgi:ABC-type nitrate/sulfonate/bicarbonate transport system substrate-binding protein